MIRYSTQTEAGRRIPLLHKLKSLLSCHFLFRNIQCRSYPSGHGHRRSGFTENLSAIVQYHIAKFATMQMDAMVKLPIFYYCPANA